MGQAHLYFFTVFPSPCNFEVVRRGTSNAPGLTVHWEAYKAPYQPPEGISELRSHSICLNCHQLMWRGCGGPCVAEYSYGQKTFEREAAYLSLREFARLPKANVLDGSPYFGKALVGRAVFVSKVVFWFRIQKQLVRGVCSYRMRYISCILARMGKKGQQIEGSFAA